MIHRGYIFGIILPIISFDRGEMATMEVISAAWDSDASLNSREGFIRVVFGRREFIVQIYQKEGEMQRIKNQFRHRKELPGSSYDATTGIETVDNVIEKVKKNAYSHHI